MQWDTTAHAGFSTATPWLPVSRPDAAWTVAHQRDDPASMLRLIRTLLGLRAEHPALSDGEYAQLPGADPRVLAFTRSAVDHRVAVVANLTDDVVPAPTEVEWTVLVSSVADEDPQVLQPFEAKVLEVCDR
jgi:glycosidase